MAGTSSPPHGAPSASPFADAPTNKIAGYFFTHSDAHRVNTDAYLYDVIKARHPGLTVTIVPEENANLLAYAAANPTIASAQPVHHDESTTFQSSQDSDNPSKPSPKWPSSLKWTMYLAPASRLSGTPGQIVQETFYDSYLYTYKSLEFLVYLVDGRDGTSFYPSVRNQYILSPTVDPVHSMVKTAGAWSSTLHDEIWVYNQGYWQKDGALYAAIQHSRWEDVILPDALKHDLMDVTSKFFSDKTRETYHRLRVPWKRGIIFYGPPGNGKTISIKATMRTLYRRHPPVPTLYVKTLASFAGPEYSINAIFEKARSEAPCYLVFEDLDSLVTPDVRSFFLNAVDGVGENEGILMVGSTNHLDRLDEGISKRPSRFDRKYEFGLPDEEMRRRYCCFWQGKLRGESKREGEAEEKWQGNGGGDDDKIEFPDVLLGKIAGITNGFSFAYMQEAFISTLLIIAGKDEGDEDQSDRYSAWKAAEVEEVNDAFEVITLGGGGVGGSTDAGKDKEGDGDSGGDGEGNDPLDKYVLWKEIKVQVALLKKEIGQKNAEMLPL